MDAVWAGVIGGGIGGVTGLLGSLGSPFVLWRVESKKLDKLQQAEKADATREYQRGLVREWREGIQAAHVAHRNTRRQSPELNPELTGLAWFESLRPNLKLDENDIRTIAETFHDSASVVMLSREVARVEKDWGLT